MKLPTAFVALSFLALVTAAEEQTPQPTTPYVRPIQYCPSPEIYFAPQGIECKQNGPVNVCAINRRNISESYSPIVHINYQKGIISILDVNVWVRVRNLRSGSFRDITTKMDPHFSRGGVWAAAALNQKGCYQCSIADSNAKPTLEPHVGPGEYPRCPNRPAVPGGADDYEITNPTAEQVEMFKGFQKNDGWAVEVAFFGPNGQWDSQYGQNYKFTFQ